MEKYNVDGFRFDLVKGLGDNGSYGSGTEAYNEPRRPHEAPPCRNQVG